MTNKLYDSKGQSRNKQIFQMFAKSCRKCSIACNREPMIIHTESKHQKHTEQKSRKCRTEK